MWLEVELLANVPVVAVHTVLIRFEELGQHVHVTHVSQSLRAVARFDEVVWTGCSRRQEPIWNPLDESDNMN